MKANRRKTWCPGGLSSLRSLADKNEDDDDDEGNVFSNERRFLSLTPMLHSKKKEIQASMGK